MRSVKATIYTLNVGDYAPEITALTYPALRGYAEKIGAAFYIIDQRLNPDKECMVEKFQIHHLAKVRDDDFSIFLDSDALVSPEMPDITWLAGAGDTVITYGKDNLTTRFQPDQYHIRDGRNIGLGNFFSCVPRICRDYWLLPWDQPDPISYEECVSRITPTIAERRAGCKPEHLFDDYATSRNLARFGLKHITWGEIMHRLGEGQHFVAHNHTLTREQKLEYLQTAYDRWYPGQRTVVRVPAADVLGSDFRELPDAGRPAKGVPRNRGRKVRR